MKTKTGVLILIAALIGTLIGTTWMLAQPSATTLEYVIPNPREIQFLGNTELTLVWKVEGVEVISIPGSQYIRVGRSSNEEWKALKAAYPSNVKTQTIVFYK